MKKEGEVGQPVETLSIRRGKGALKLLAAWCEEFSR
jgi:hypothetical protein